MTEEPTHEIPCAHRAAWDPAMRTEHRRGWCSDPAVWCRRGDSNPHGFPHHPLKMACLPVPPLRHLDKDLRACGWSSATPGEVRLLAGKLEVALGSAGLESAGLPPVLGASRRRLRLGSRRCCRCFCFGLLLHLLDLLRGRRGLLAVDLAAGADLAGAGCSALGRFQNRLACRLGA